MKIRRIASLTAMLAFCSTLLTSFILFVVPQGRIADWADWRLWGITKEEWAAIHTNLGILFLVSLFLHIYYNWKPITTYLKNKTKQLRVFTPEFNVSLVIIALFALFTYLGVPPISYLQDLNASIKDQGARTYGEPPYGHAELASLKSFAQRMDYDLEKGIELLKKAGFTVENEKQTLADLGRINKIAPQQIYLAMRDAALPSSSEQTGIMPELAPSGLGQKTVADICELYKLDVPTIVKGLSAKNIPVEPDHKIKDVAVAMNGAPVDVYDAIRQIALAAPAVKADEHSGSAEGQGTGIGKMTLADVCRQNGIDQVAALDKLKAGGIEAAPDQAMRDIAGKYGKTPNELLELIKS